MAQSQCAPSVRGTIRQLWETASGVVSAGPDVRQRQGPEQRQVVQPSLRGGTDLADQFVRGRPQCQ
jgi:hypothetical protein